MFAENHDPYKEEEERIRALMQENRMYFFSQAILCTLIQVLLLSLILREIIMTNLQQLQTLEATPIILIFRMFCGLLLHLSLVDNVVQALDRMKFANNHSYLFSSMVSAVLLSFLQFVMVVWVEFSNLLVILTCFEPINIMENFVALSIVSEFDQMFFASMG